jgi:hypothetical protein
MLEGFMGVALILRINPEKRNFSAKKWLRECVRSRREPVPVTFLGIGRHRLTHFPAVDVLALAAVTVARAGAASTGINAFCETRHKAKPAREDRAEQRAADGSLKVLSLAEQEALWLDSRVYNHRFGLGIREMGLHASA